MPLTRLKKRKAEEDLRNRAMTLVFEQDHLGWYRLEQLQIVCKDWKTIVREVNHTDLPIWDEIIQYINRINGANMCENCGERLANTYCCICGCSDEDRPLAYMDPRSSPMFEVLSKYKQACSLLGFHKTCIKNLMSFYNHDNFTEDKSTATGWHWYDDFFFSMGSLVEQNPKVYWLLLVIVELSIAKNDLKGAPYYFDWAFAGIACEPFTGSSFRDCIHGEVLHVIGSVEPSGGSNERRITVRDWGSYTPSQIANLEGALRRILTERDERADELFGPHLADQMNVFYPVRIKTLSKFHEMFPLRWMPVFDDNFVPPGPFDHLLEN